MSRSLDIRELRQLSTAHFIALRTCRFITAESRIQGAIPTTVLDRLDGAARLVQGLPGHVCPVNLHPALTLADGRPFGQAADDQLRRAAALRAMQRRDAAAALDRIAVVLGLADRKGPEHVPATREARREAGRESKHEATSAKRGVQRSEKRSRRKVRRDARGEKRNDVRS